MKPVIFCGRSLEDLRLFPAAARRECGLQIDRLQRGLMPGDSKALTMIGPGVREIRVRDQAGAFRVIYVLDIGSSILVLHCFQKKTQRTAKHDVALARARYKELMKGGRA